MCAVDYLTSSLSQRNVVWKLGVSSLRIECISSRRQPLSDEGVEHGMHPLGVVGDILAAIAEIVLFRHILPKIDQRPDFPLLQVILFNQVITRSSSESRCCDSLPRHQQGVCE